MRKVTTYKFTARTFRRDIRCIREGRGCNILDEGIWCHFSTTSETSGTASRSRVKSSNSHWFNRLKRSTGVSLSIFFIVPSRLYSAHWCPHRESQKYQSMGPSRILVESIFHRGLAHQRQYDFKPGLHDRADQDLDNITGLLSFSESTDEKEDVMEHIFGDQPHLTRQEEIDLAFAALDEYLEAQRPPSKAGGCVNCGGVYFTTSSDALTSTARVCSDCGVVQPGIDVSSLQSTEYISRKVSNYKRVHHFHERVSQLLLNESPIPNEQFVQIASKLTDGTYSVINKDTIRAVLRSLNLQIYIEKWLQIIWRVTSITPPIPGSIILQQLDSMFNALQEPFSQYKIEGRKNFLNYNYVFCRLFQEIGCPQFSMFFPLIKSKQKLKALDDMWRPMIESIGWTFKPLQPAPAFAVRLEIQDINRIKRVLIEPYSVERPLSETRAALSLTHPSGVQAQAVQQEVHSQKGFQRSGHYHQPRISKRDQRLLRSIQAGQRSRKQGYQGCAPWYRWRAEASQTQSPPREPLLRLHATPKGTLPWKPEC